MAFSAAFNADIAWLMVTICHVCSAGIKMGVERIASSEGCWWWGCTSRSLAALPISRLPTRRRTPSVCLLLVSHEKTSHPIVKDPRLPACSFAAPKYVTNNTLTARFNSQRTWERDPLLPYPSVQFPASLFTLCYLGNPS